MYSYSVLLLLCIFVALGLMQYILIDIDCHQNHDDNTLLFRLLLMMSNAVLSYQRYKNDDYQSHNHQSSAKEYSKNITIYNH